MNNRVNQVNQQNLYRFTRRFNEIKEKSYYNQLYQWQNYMNIKNKKENIYLNGYMLKSRYIFIKKSKEKFGNGKMVLSNLIKLY